MAEPSRIIGDQEFAGACIFTGGVTISDNSLSEDAISASAVIPHTVLVHRMPITHTQESTDVAIASKTIIHQAYRDATVLGMEASVYDVSTSTGRNVTIDILKSTGGSTGTSILSEAMVINSTNDSDRTPRAATLSGTPTLKDGNALIRKITVAGSTGTQSKGLCTQVMLAEDPIN